MPRFVSETYPQLVVHDLGVRFTDGEAVVPDAKAKKLKAAGIPGVRAVGGRPSATGDQHKQPSGDEPPAVTPEK